MWWLWFNLAGAQAPGHGPEVVDRVVAIVGEDPVLASEVALQRDLALYDTSPLPLWTSERPLEEVAIQAAIVRTLADEAPLYQPQQTDVVARAQALRDALGSDWEPFLSAHGLDLPALQRELRRKMIVERFLLRALATDPDDAPSWMTAYDVLLGDLGARVRIRRIAPRGPSAP